VLRVPSDLGYPAPNADSAWCADCVFAGDEVVQIGPFWLSHGSFGQF